MSTAQVLFVVLLVLWACMNILTGLFWGLGTVDHDYAVDRLPTFGETPKPCDRKEQAIIGVCAALIAAVLSFVVGVLFLVLDESTNHFWSLYAVFASTLLMLSFSAWRWRKNTW